MIDMITLTATINAYSALDPYLFINGMLWLIGSMVAMGTGGAVALTYLDWANNEDAKDHYHYLVMDLESEDLAMELVDSLYSRAQKSADYIGLLAWVDENPEAAQWLSDHGYEYGFDKYLPQHVVDAQRQQDLMDQHEAEIEFIEFDVKPTPLDEGGLIYLGDAQEIEDEASINAMMVRLDAALAKADKTSVKSMIEDLNASLENMKPNSLDRYMNRAR